MESAYAHDMEIPFQYTVMTLLQAKLFNWTRRSLIKYLIVALIFGTQAQALGWTLEPGFSWKYFLSTLIGLIILSMVLMTLSAFWIMKKLSAEGKEKFTIQFTEEGLKFITQRGTETKEWSWIREQQYTRQGLLLRGQDGLFQQLYIPIEKAKIPTKDYENLTTLIHRKTKT